MEAILQTERAHAEAHSSLANKAAATLRCPLRRSKHLLQLTTNTGGGGDEDDDEQVAVVGGAGEIPLFPPVLRGGRNPSERNPSERSGW